MARSKSGHINSGEKLRGNKDVASKQLRRVGASPTPATPRWTFREFPDPPKPSKPTMTLSDYGQSYKKMIAKDEAQIRSWLDAWARSCYHRSFKSWDDSTPTTGWGTHNLIDLARFIAFKQNEQDFSEGGLYIPDCHTCKERNYAQALAEVRKLKKEFEGLK